MCEDRKSVVRLDGPGTSPEGEARYAVTDAAGNAREASLAEVVTAHGGHSIDGMMAVLRDLPEFSPGDAVTFSGAGLTDDGCCSGGCRVGGIVIATPEDGWAPRGFSRK